MSGYTIVYELRNGSLATLHVPTEETVDVVEVARSVVESMEVNEFVYTYTPTHATALRSSTVARLTASLATV